MIFGFAAAMMACNAKEAAKDDASNSAVAAAVSQGEAAHAVKAPENDTQIRPDMKVSRPLIIDFNATWCGPCRMFTPVFDEVANKYAGKVDFISIDTDKYPQTAQAFAIQAIPTIVFILPDGTVESHTGLGDFLVNVPEDATQEQAVKAMADEFGRMVKQTIKK